MQYEAAGSVDNIVGREGEQITTPNGQPRTQGGVYVAVWRKQPNGEWKVLVDEP
jgi:ketosteroid isomerase-like protein